MKYDPVAACRFFSPEDVCRWALAAYYGASRDGRPPRGQPWRVEGVEWSSPAMFAWSVHHRFTEALNAAATRARILCDSGCATTDLGWDDSAAVQRLLLRPQLNDLPVTKIPGNNALGGEVHGV